MLLSFGMEETNFSQTFTAGCMNVTVQPKHIFVPVPMFDDKPGHNVCFTDLCVFGYVPEAARV